MWRGPRGGPAARGAKYRAAVRKAESEGGPGLPALRIGAAGWGCGCGGSIFQVWVRSSREDRRVVLFILWEAGFHRSLYPSDGGGSEDGPLPQPAAPPV